MLKKFLATALAAAMILGFAGIAFAGSFTDAEGHPREAAIEKLVGLGLFQGYGDGTIRPDNPITRAEFCKLIVVALGYGETAGMMEGIPTGFSDVASNHWASGYINIATNQDIILGYPDGTFQPEKNVDYSEVLTMILRALGYKPILEGKPWPAAYLTKATELKLNAGISFTASDPATRGDVAGLLNNSVTVAKLVQVGFGDSQSYVISGSTPTAPPKETLLQDMGATPATGWLVSSPEIFANTTGNLELDSVVTSFPTIAGLDTAGLLGHKVCLWANEDDKVFFVEDLTPAESIKAGSFVTAEPTKVKVGTTTYTPAGLVMLKDYTAPAALALSATDEITVIFDGTSPKYVLVQNYNWGVVDYVNTTYKKVVFSDGTPAVLDLDKITVSWLGAVSSIADLQKNDVVQYIKSGSKAVLVVTRNTVQGTFAKMTTASGINSVTIDGVAYAEQAAATSGVASGNIGKEVTLILNKSGKIAKLIPPTATAGAAPDVGVLLAETLVADDWSTASIPKLRLFKADGTKVEVLSHSEVEFTAVDGTTKTTYKGTGGGVGTDLVDVLGVIKPNDIVEYKLNKDGKITHIALKYVYTAPTAPPIATEEHKIDRDRAFIDKTAGAGSIDYVVVGDSTTVFDLRTAGSPAVMGVSTLLANEWIKGGVVVDGVSAKVVAVTAASAVAAPKQGVVVGRYQAPAGTSVGVYAQILVGGSITDYLVDSTIEATFGSIGNKAVVDFTLTGTKITSIAATTLNIKPSDPTNFEQRVTAVDLASNLIKVKEFHKTDPTLDKAAVTYLVDSKTLYFDVTGTPASKTLGDVTRNAMVELATGVGGIVTVIVITEY